MNALDRLMTALATGKKICVDDSLSNDDLRALMAVVQVAMELPITTTNRETFKREEVIAMPAMGPMNLDMFKLLATVEALEYWKWRCNDHSMNRSRDLFVVAGLSKENSELKKQLNDIAEFLGCAKPMRELGRAPDAVSIIGVIKMRFDGYRTRMKKLRDYAVQLLERAKPWSANGQADSDIRADMQRELFVLADDR